MGLPILSIIAEIYLQFFKEICIKHWIENGKISYYKRYVDDTLIIFDQSKTNKNLIQNLMSNIYKHLELKVTEEENNNINYLDLTIHGHHNKLSTEIYRKPTQTDISIHFTSNHPFEQKFAALISYINRMITLYITEQAKHQEWNTIPTIAKNNGFPSYIIHNLRNKLITKTQHTFTIQTHQKKIIDHIHLSQPT
jgi:hypothetical protein